MSPECGCCVLQADEQAALLRQLEQGGVGPGWEPQDWLWRPTVCEWGRRPAARLLQLPATMPAGTSADADACGEQQTSTREQALVPVQQPGPAVAAMTDKEEEQEVLQYRQLLVSYLNGLAELEGARQAVQVAADEQLLAGYSRALRAAVQEQPGGPAI
jgi:hypothetical protein